MMNTKLILSMVLTFFAVHVGAQTKSLCAVGSARRRVLGHRLRQLTVTVFAAWPDPQPGLGSPPASSPYWRTNRGRFTAFTTV